MKKENEYYGIKFNDKIPKIDKVNKFTKEVKIEFEGKAYLIKRNEDNEVIERKEIENGYKLKKEKEYEIAFINYKNKIYNLQVRIESSCLIFILLLFWLGFLIGLILTRPVKDNHSLLDRFYDFINLSVIQLDIDKTTEQENAIEEQVKRTRIIENIKYVKKEVEDRNQYEFDATFKNISSDEISLTNSMTAKAVAKNKIAPRNFTEVFQYW